MINDRKILISVGNHRRSVSWHLSVKHECYACRRGNVKNVVCVYHGMLISFRMHESEVAAFTKILHDNGALMIEVLPFD